MKKYTPSYRDIDVGGGMTSIQVFMDDVPKWLEGFEEEYVPADLAEEMLEALEAVLQILSIYSNGDTPDHKDETEALKKAQSIIAKAEEV